MSEALPEFPAPDRAPSHPVSPCATAAQRRSCLRVRAALLLLLLPHPLGCSQQDTQICSGARVFYVAYKFVEEYWPDSLAAPDNHITAHPVHFYLDGLDTQVGGVCVCGCVWGGVEGGGG